MQPVWCFCHSDLDGVCSGAVVRQKYPNASVLLCNYGKPIPIYKCKPGDLVYVTDFSFPYNDFMRLKQKGCEIIWIDHHEANYQQLANAGWSCEGIRRNDYCGAALTWMYLHPAMDPEQMPQAIKFVNDYDLWQYKFGDKTKDFSIGIGLWDMRPGNRIGDALWKDLLSSDSSPRMELILKYGNHIRQYIELWQDTLCKDLAYKTTIQTKEGAKKILALTVRAGNSSVFDNMDKSDVDAVFQAQFIGNIGKFRCSMYSPDNVKEILPIVQEFGGGGHPKAAGFQFNSWPLPVPELKDPPNLKEAMKGYIELERIRNSSVILKQWISKACNITMRVTGFHAAFGGTPCLAFNHYCLFDMLPVANLATDCIDPDTQAAAKMYIGFVQTNCGWYRCSAYPTDTSTTIAEILETVKKSNPDADRTAEIIHDGVWWYTRDVPVKLPEPIAFVPSM